MRITLPEAERMGCICRFRFADGWRWRINHLCNRQDSRRRRAFTIPSYEHDACGVGFVVHVKGHRSHAIVQQALQVLINLLHRGACGCEANTGDGAGILLQMPDKFLRREAARLGIDAAARAPLRRRMLLPAA